MVERLRPECIDCLLKQLHKIPEETTNDLKLEYMQRVLKVLAEAPKSASAPVLVRTINDIQKEMFGYEYDYSETKKYFNQLMLEKEAVVQSKIEASKEPLKLAIQYAMTGNYIDFGALNCVDEEQLNKLLAEVNENDINVREYEALVRDLSTAENVVYLTDNCGEIVLDKVLIRQIQKDFPNIHITVIVKGGAVLNDATMEDAGQVGLDKLTVVTDNGNNIAGTCLEKLSEGAVAILDHADVILSKGQANYETLRKCGKNIYYIFMCKCDMFAKGFQVPKFSGILVNDKNCV